MTATALVPGGSDVPESSSGSITRRSVTRRWAPRLVTDCVAPAPGVDLPRSRLGAVRTSGVGTRSGDVLTSVLVAPVGVIVPAAVVSVPVCCSSSMPLQPPSASASIAPVAILATAERRIAPEGSPPIPLR